MSALCPATIQFSAWSSDGSWQSEAPTYRMLAPGASACTASTSSVCSPYQPAASHLSGGSCATFGGKTCSANCDFCSGLAGSLRLAYSAASEYSVGEANASTIATVEPAPLDGALSTP